MSTADELAALIAQQDHDARTGHRVYSVSLYEARDLVVDGDGAIGAFGPSRRRMLANDPVHGTTNGYVNYRCRCGKCRKAWADYCRTKNHRKGYNRPRAVWLAMQKLLTSERHGTEGTYARCKCDLCRTAANKARLLRRHRAKAAA